MTGVTVTDLFCGAGGSSVGAVAAGMTLAVAANHWQTAIDVHQTHFPDARHDCADISQADPRRYPRTRVLLASPECTNHSQARGVSRRRQDPSLWDAPDPSAERSRATMWDVPRFAEQVGYDAIVVENVVEATAWVMWPAWWQAMECLGYRGRVVSANSMHHGVAQSRDRIYVAWARAGIDIDLEFEQSGWCGRCDSVRTCRQAWKNGRSVGRYRSQWVWRCVDCGTTVEPAVRGAADIIDWDLPVQRIGDRARPLAANTRRRIAAGLARYGWTEPIVTTGAGNTHERTPGNRARPLTDPLPTQQTTATSALAVPFLLNTAHGGRIHDVAAPHPTVCASDDRLSLITTLRGTNAGQIEASARPGSSSVRPILRPVPTVPTRDRFALVDPDVAVDDCGFRMLEPQEVAAAMAFPDGYIPSDLSKKDRVKLAGNAVTPPVMTAIAERIMAALREAA
ncbi:DNA cytosine methyltransferase [Accumulibacter sp.]|uniref:DNA cytosine methyltransferase n=1 Tax=Accumulibacter sp. TaxID=2053492 RepID=UPI00258266AF|nr:DNA cytosine methyltransferase [Accumulibacter sp.]